MEIRKKNKHSNMITRMIELTNLDEITECLKGVGKKTECGGDAVIDFRNLVIGMLTVTSIPCIFHNNKKLVITEKHLEV